MAARNCGQYPAGLMISGLRRRTIGRYSSMVTGEASSTRRPVLNTEPPRSQPGICRVPAPSCDSASNRRYHMTVRCLLLLLPTLALAQNFLKSPDGAIDMNFSADNG